MGLVVGGAVGWLLPLVARVDFRLRMVAVPLLAALFYFTFPDWFGSVAKRIDPKVKEYDRFKRDELLFELQPLMEHAEED